MQIGLRLPQKLLPMANAHFWYKHLGLGPAPKAPKVLNTYNQWSGYKTDTIYRKTDINGAQHELDLVEVPWEIIASGDMAVSPDDSTLIVWNPTMPAERVKELYIAASAKSAPPLSDLPSQPS